MKLLLALTGCVVCVVLLPGCGAGPTSAPSVTYEPILEGTELRLSWSAVQDAEGYKVYVDGAEEADITGTSYDVAGPAKTVGVSAYGDGDETNQWTLDLGPTITTSLTVYGRGDTASAHPSGFGFVTDGTAVTYPLSDSSNWPNLDFYLEDVGVPMTLCSPDVRNYNTKFNGSIEAATTNFDALDIAALVDAGYTDQTELAVNGVYSIWIDPNANGWDDTNDHFGKIHILSISGHTVTMKLAYQRVSGLLWVVTP